MELYIFRHGEADAREAGMPDRDRALTPRGKRDVKAVAALARRAKVAPDMVFTSPLRRARETAALAAEVFGTGKPVETKALTPEARPEAIWKEIVDLVSKQKGAVDQIMLAGHEPHMSRLIVFLLEAAVVVDLKKGSLVRVSTPGKNGPPRGVLKWMITPRIAQGGK